MDFSDAQLLDAYVRQKSEAAFAELVGRYIDVVHGSAMRQLPDRNQADDVTQAVFIILAKKAEKIRGDYLAGWLLNTTRFCVADVRKREGRRLRHEQQAAAMKTYVTENPDSSQEEIRQHLDEAIGCLPPRQSTAIIMRFLQNKSPAEVADAMGISYDAAQKIIARSLPKLRRILSRRGLTLSSTAGLSEAMLLASRHVAPAALHITPALPTPSGMLIAKSAMKIMAWAKAQTIAASVTAMLLVGGGAGLALTHYNGRAQASSTVAVSPATQTSGFKPYASPFLQLSGCRIVRQVQVKIATGPAQPAAEIKAYEEEELAINCILTPEISQKADRAVETIISEDGSELGKQIMTFTNAKGLELHSRFLRLAPPAGDYMIRVDAMDASKNLIARRTVPLHVEPLVKTLIEIGDILPDGSIHFFGVEQQSNSGNSAISEDHLNTDSLFDAMFDASGRPIEFSTKHAHSGNMVQFKLNNPVQPQQAMIIGATGSIKNVVKHLSSGVLRYSEHDGDPGPIRRLNLYRLPAGAKVLSLDSPGLRQRTVDGRIQVYMETTLGPDGQCDVDLRYQLANP